MGGFQEANIDPEISRIGEPVRHTPRAANLRGLYLAHAKLCDPKHESLRASRLGKERTEKGLNVLLLVRLFRVPLRSFCYCKICRDSV